MENKSNNRLQFYFFIVFLVSYLGISAWFLVLSYNDKLMAAEMDQSSKLSGIVNTIATQIDGDKYQALMKEYPESGVIKTPSQVAGYAEIYALLKDAQDGSDLKEDIYLLTVPDPKNPRDAKFGVSTAIKDYQKSYKLPDLQAGMYLTGGVLEPYESDNGKWISAFAPIKNSSGNVVAVVQADRDFTDFYKQTRDEVIKTMLTVLVPILFVLALLIVILDYINHAFVKERKGFEREFSFLSKTVEQVQGLLENIKNKNFDFEIKTDGTAKQNELFSYLVATKDDLARSVKQDSERQWIAEGISKVGEILRSHRDLELLGLEIVKEVVEYTTAVQGAFFLKEEREGEVYLKMVSRYAYNRKKYQLEDVKLGHGLIGQCAFEKDSIYRIEIPEDYTSITSGLISDKKPGAIFIVPLMSENELNGVVEFAAITEIPELQRTFISQVAKITGQTVFNLITNTRTESLLEEQKKLSSELQENTEELQRSQVELQESNEKLEVQIREVENSQKRLNSLLAEASEIITIYDADHNISYISPSVDHILGYKEEELIGANDITKVHKEDQKIVNELFEKTLAEKGAGYDLQFRYKKADGAIVWLEASTRNLLHDPAIKGVIVNTRDITERREAEKEQEMRAKMQALSENSQDIILRFDLEGKFLYANARLGYYTDEKGDVLGKELGDTGVNEELKIGWKEIADKIVEQKKIVQQEVVFNSDGEVMYMMVNAIPEFDKNEQLETILFVSHDITEAKKQELQISLANKKITDSINYARRIQDAIIPLESEIKESFPESFSYYMAKDVVSGDFPYFFKKGDWVYYAAVDCTGHGVPGAMMSLIGFLHLNHICEHQATDSPAFILDQLHKGVVSTLKQDAEGNSAADGMDVAICAVNTKTNEVAYAGAHRPLYHLRNGEIIQYKGDRFPVGGAQYKKRTPFQDFRFKAEPGDSIFFFSDGFPDQFGGPEKLKFGPKRIRNIIEENSGKTMPEIHDLFERNFIDWKGEHKQMDDVLLIGIQF